MAERRHAAILFTDIVGYTTLMGSDVGKAFLWLEKTHNEGFFWLLSIKAIPSGMIGCAMLIC